jgi:hypothetical protein
MLLLLLLLLFCSRNKDTTEPSVAFEHGHEMD